MLGFIKSFLQDRLLLATRRREAEIDTAGGELFGVLKIGEAVVIHTGLLKTFTFPHARLEPGVRETATTEESADACQFAR